MQVVYILLKLRLGAILKPIYYQMCSTNFKRKKKRVQIFIFFLSFLCVPVCERERDRERQEESSFSNCMVICCEIISRVRLFKVFASVIRAKVSFWTQMA